MCGCVQQNSSIWFFDILAQDNLESNKGAGCFGNPDPPPQTVCVWLVFYIVSIPNLFPLNFGIRKEASYIHGKGKEEAPSFEELQSDYQHFEWRVIGSNVKELGDDLKLHITLLDSISWEMVTEALWTPSLS